MNRRTWGICAALLSVSVAACSGDDTRPVTTVPSDPPTSSTLPDTTTTSSTIDSAQRERAEAVVLAARDLPAFRESDEAPAEVDLSGCNAPELDALTKPPVAVRGATLERGQDGAFTVTSTAAAGDEDAARKAIEQARDQQVADCTAEARRRAAGEGGPAQVTVTAKAERSTVSGIDESSLLTYEVTVKVAGATVVVRRATQLLRHGDILATATYQAPGGQFSTTEQRQVVTELARKLRAAATARSTTTAAGGRTTTTAAGGAGRTTTTSGTGRTTTTRRTTTTSG